MFLGCAAWSFHLAAQEPTPATPTSPPKPAVTSPLGDRCAKCHKQVVQDFPYDQHGRSAHFTDGDEKAGCDSCHGNGEKHRRDPKPNDILNPGKMAPKEASETCLTCHARDSHTHSWRGSPHDTAKLGCLSCHSAHRFASAKAMLVKLSETETCLTCHTDLKKAFYQRSTHLIRTELRETKVGCVSCHNPHGGEGPHQLVAVSNTRLCYTCHADKRGPFLWEHAPVREDCITCHLPHGSNHESLLKARSHVLCQSCHINMISRHQTVAGFDVFTFNRSCVNCHSQIHGSNHPSGRQLTR
jgi:DmsE family decaheme c-type cytochrome